MTSDDILKHLRARHSDDVFVTECKDGPTQSVRNYLRMDAWVMPRSWSRPDITAYEIKVSRRDFVRDDKWQKYLPLCNRLYFAAAPGCVEKDELPPEVGLLEMTNGGGRLLVRKVAPRREVVIPEPLWRYVLMCRCRITGEQNADSGRAYWERQMASDADDIEFGHKVGKWMRKRIEDQILKVGVENTRLKAVNEDLDEIRKFIVGLGLDPKKPYVIHSVERRLKEIEELLPPRLIDDIGHVRSSLESLLKRIEAEKKKLQEPNGIPAPV